MDILWHTHCQCRKNDIKSGIAKPMDKISTQREGYQMNFFQLDGPVLSQIRDEINNLDINNLTPVEALNKLDDIKRIVRGK